MPNDVLLFAIYNLFHFATQVKTDIEYSDTRRASLKLIPSQMHRAAEMVTSDAEM